MYFIFEFYENVGYLVDRNNHIIVLNTKKSMHATEIRKRKPGDKIFLR